VPSVALLAQVRYLYCPLLPVTQHHATPAFLANRKAGQERRARHYARRRDPGFASLEGTLNGIEGRLGHDNGNIHPDPFGGRACLARPAIDAIVIVDADIGLVLEDSFHRCGVERPAAIAVALGVQVCGDGFDTHRPATIVAIEIEAEHQVDDGRLCSIDFEDFFLLAAQNQRDPSAVAEGRSRAVPVALFGVGHHHVADDAGINLALMTVKGREDGLHQFAMGAFWNILRCRDQADTSVLQLLLVVQILGDVAEEPRKSVDDDEVNPIGRIAGKLQHFLEFGPAIGAGR